MTLCLLESIGRLKTIDYDDVMKNFVKWMKNAECALKAVNLGDDTDTVGAIAGGLA